MLHAAPEGGQIIAAEDPVKGGRPPRSSVISRVNAREAVWVSVLEPFADAPSVTGLSAVQEGGGLRIQVAHADGADELIVPAALNGDVTLRRMDAGGEVTAQETARPGTGAA
jgi:hypothetical protein